MILRLILFLSAVVSASEPDLVLRGGKVFNLPVHVIAIHSCLSALIMWVSILPLIASLLTVVIIGSWIAMFSGSTSTMYVCNEWMTFLLGPLRRYPIRIGMLDLTPLIALLALPYLEMVMRRLLLACDTMLIQPFSGTM